MTMVEENDLAIEEAVKAFLNNALDIIEKGELENDTDNVESIVKEVLDAVTEKVGDAVEEPEMKSDNLEAACSVTAEHTDDSTREHTEYIKAEVHVKSEGHIEADVKTDKQTQFYVKTKEKTEDIILTDGQGDVLFSNFSKLALYSVEIKRGKVKIGHGDGLRKKEKYELKKEAKELFDYVGMLKKQTLANRKRLLGKEKELEPELEDFTGSFAVGDQRPMINVL